MPREVKPFVQRPRSLKPQVLDLNPGIPAPMLVLLTILLYHLGLN